MAVGRLERRVRGFQPLAELFVKATSFGFIVPVQVNVYRSHQQVIRPETRIHRLRVLQAFDEESRAYQQHQGQSDLGNGVIPSDARDLEVTTRVDDETPQSPKLLRDDND